MVRCKWLIILLCVSGLCSAQLPEQQLFSAWLKQDMTVWSEQLNAQEWSSLSADQRNTYLTYEYGYVAAAIDAKQADAQRLLDTLVVHIQAQRSALPTGIPEAYLSACAAYQGRLHKIELPAQGIRSRKYAHEALEIAPDNPVVLNMNGCVDFYAPEFFGGDKKRALGYFQKAKQNYEQQGDTLNNWQYASNNMQLVMCLDKVGRTQEAIELAQKLLIKDPDFTFIRDTYLPQMLNR